MGGNAPRPGPAADVHTALELAGHTVLTLNLAASKPDAALARLPLEQEPDGTVRYVTEGYCAPYIASSRPTRRLSRKRAVSQLQSRRCGAARSGTPGRNRHRTLAGRLAFRQGQPGSAGDRGCRCRPLRSGATRAPGRLQHQSGQVVSRFAVRARRRGSRSRCYPMGSRSRSLPAEMHLGCSPDLSVVAHSRAKGSRSWWWTTPALSRRARVSLIMV